MFKEVPPADAYVLKLIMHDWDDAACATILANVCARLEPGGRVICIDNVMPPLGDVSDVPQKLLDVNMMLLLPGKERTRVEWEALYRGAGLAITAMVPVPDAFNMFVIEGRRVADARLSYGVSGNCLEQPALRAVGRARSAARARLGTLRPCRRCPAESTAIMCRPKNCPPFSPMRPISPTRRPSARFKNQMRLFVRSET